VEWNQDRGEVETAEGSIQPARLAFVLRDLVDGCPRTRYKALENKPFHSHSPVEQTAKDGWRVLASGKWAPEQDRPRRRGASWRRLLAPWAKCCDHRVSPHSSAALVACCSRHIPPVVMIFAAVLLMSKLLESPRHWPKERNVWGATRCLRGYRCRTCTEHVKCTFKRQESIQPDGTIGEDFVMSPPHGRAFSTETQNRSALGVLRAEGHISNERSTRAWSSLACSYGDLVIPEPYKISETTYCCASFEFGQGALNCCRCCRLFSTHLSQAWIRLTAITAYSNPAFRQSLSSAAGLQYMLNA